MDHGLYVGCEVTTAAVARGEKQGPGGTVEEKEGVSDAIHFRRRGHVLIRDESLHSASQGFEVRGRWRLGGEGGVIGRGALPAA